MPKANVASRYLEEAIQGVIRNKDQYVTNPGKDFSRNRKLGLEDLIHMLINMGGGSLTQEIIKYSKYANTDVTKSALVQQRQKLLSTAFLAIHEMFIKKCAFKNKLKGYRLFAVDGTDINIFPNEGDTLVSKEGEKPYSLMHLNALYDLYNNAFLCAIAQGKRVADERNALIKMLPNLDPNEKAIVIADRGYESFNVMAHFVESKHLDLILRVKQGKGAVREIAALPMTELDCDLRIGITTRQTKEDKAAGRHFIQTGSKKGKKNSPKTAISKWDFSSPYDLKIRVVRFKLDTGKYETLVTTLPRNRFSRDDLKELYHKRWGIETSFRHLKYATGLAHIKAKGLDMALQEIYISLIKYNYSESIIGEIVIYQSKQNKNVYVVNHTAAIQLCLDFFRNRSKDFRELEIEILRYTLPHRPGRKDKRKNVQAKSFTWFAYRVAA